jgi:hypothetical protein
MWDLAGCSRVWSAGTPYRFQSLSDSTISSLRVGRDWVCQAAVRGSMLPEITGPASQKVQALPAAAVADERPPGARAFECR